MNKTQINLMMNRRGNYLLKIVIINILIFFQFSCRDNKKKESSFALKKKANIEKPIVKNRYLIIKGDSVEVTSGNRKISIAKRSVFNYNNTYPGIYQIKNDSLVSLFSVEKNGILYFTTYEDAGRGYLGFLHAYDLRNKLSIEDYTTKDRYIQSSAGMFFFENGLIYAVEKPNFYFRKNFFFTTAGIYRLKGRKFKYVKTIYAKGEKTYADTSIIDFYNKNIKNKPRKLLIIPKDWWKQ